VGAGNSDDVASPLGGTKASQTAIKGKKGGAPAVCQNSEGEKLIGGTCVTALADSEGVGGTVRLCVIQSSSGMRRCVKEGETSVSTGGQTEG